MTIDMLLLEFISNSNFPSFSCAFLAGVSAKYILLISPSIEEYLSDTAIGFNWSVKLVAVALMSRYFCSCQRGFIDILYIDKGLSW